MAKIEYTISTRTPTKTRRASAIGDQQGGHGGDEYHEHSAGPEPQAHRRWRDQVAHEHERRRNEQRNLRRTPQGNAYAGDACVAAGHWSEESPPRPNQPRFGVHEFRGRLVGRCRFHPRTRQERLNSNQTTILGGAALGLVYALMAVVRDPMKFFIVAGLAGAAWTISASELWVAGQRVIPDWIRGRMSATHMMVSQAGMALAGLLWGALATGFGFEWALFSASALGFASAVAATRWSIDFATRINVEADPLTVEYHSHFLPEADDGPITATMEIEVAPENHIRFFRLMEEIRLIYFRKERSAPRLDQDFENPNRFRLQAMFISWGGSNDSINESRETNMPCGPNSGHRTAAKNPLGQNATLVASIGNLRSRAD